MQSRISLCEIRTYIITVLIRKKKQEYNDYNTQRDVYNCENGRVSIKKMHSRGL